MKKETENNEAKGEEPRQGSLLLNAGKTALLIAVLVAAWFILEKIIGNK